MQRIQHLLFNRRHLPLILFFFLLHAKAQHKGPVASFSFNNKKDYDEISKRKAKLIGAGYTADRFNNENNAVFLYGNPFSYINLGNYPALKPKSGSISIWIKPENVVWAGMGYTINPIILTKNSNNNDFYEAYCIYYVLNTKKINAGCSLDSTLQASLSSLSTLEFVKWHHLVLAYDFKHIALYIDGRLENRLSKNFETRFIATDSVLVGVSANKKNNRASNMAVDDITFYDHVLTEKEVQDLYHAPNPNKYKIALNGILMLLAIAAFIILVYYLVRYQLSLTLKKEKQNLELYNLVLETELRVNRALMNPHFVFNSLNALQNFILKNENDRANDYLVKFSKLMRKILENNMSDSISLEMELDLLTKYLEIEDLRFEENISHIICVDPSINPSSIKIPIMMLQPFIENAIWHGLLKKPGEKILKASFFREDNEYLRCVIEDNGIDRKKSEGNTLERKSLGIGFVKQRLKLFNNMYHLNCSLLIEDKPGHTGTVVTIILPILNK